MKRLLFLIFFLCFYVSVQSQRALSQEKTPLIEEKATQLTAQYNQVLALSTE